MKFLINETYKEITINKLIVAGWTGRDMSSVQAHIDELLELGVAPPSSVPLFYQVSSQMVTQDDEIQVLSMGTSGEVEPFIVYTDKQYWFGIASDHTDRDLESFSVAHSKQVCPKPVSSELWLFDDIKDHIEEIQLTSWLDEGQGWTKYQQGTLKQIRPIEELISKSKLTENSAMLCGTFPAIGGVRRTAKFKMEAFDPVLKRTIEFSYITVELDVVN